jgi:murein DD-endopeptidase MepM/ murein hydrolase activator NlpD
MSQKRFMARPIQSQRRSPTRMIGTVAAVIALVVVGAFAASNLLAGGNSPRSSSSGIAALPSATTTRSIAGVQPTEGTSPRSTPGQTPAGSDRTPKPPRETQTPIPNPKPTPLPRRTPRPTPTADPDRAPTTPDGFDLDGQVIEIGFPLRRQTRYHYRNNFLDAREGTPDAYNHERLHKDGSAVRAHDGTDIYANQGEPLIAVFSGTVIDPRTRWRPWEPDRYGKTIALVSDDPRTDGYTALYVHASDVWVSVGDHVERGQVLGTVGRTGNADGTDVPSHLHFELRAPFLIDWTAHGEGRRIDAFNPFPSLVAADPKH